MNNFAAVFLIAVALMVLVSARADIMAFIQDCVREFGLSTPIHNISVAELERSLEAYGSKADRGQAPGLFVLATLPAPLPLAIPTQQLNGTEPVSATAPKVVSELGHVTEEEKAAFAAEFPPEFIDDDVSDSVVEPPEDWESIPQYQGRSAVFDYSEMDRYNIEETANTAAPRMLSDEYFDEARGFYQAPVYEIEPAAT